MGGTTDWEKLWEENKKYYYSRRDKRYGSDEFLHSSKKEYYGEDLNFSATYYNGRFYYIKKGFLCVSDETGGNREILADLYIEYQYIHVNITGIYVYDTTRSEHVWVRHIGFDGQTISECKEEYDKNIEHSHNIHDLYFYDNKLYYAYENQKYSYSQLKCMDIDTGKVSVLYDKAYKLGRVFANKNVVIFNASYINNEHEESYTGNKLSDSGWIMLDLDKRNIECISKRLSYSPEKVLSNPEIYDKGSGRDYDKNAESFKKIHVMNLHYGIYWIEVFSETEEYYNSDYDYDRIRRNRYYNYFVPIYMWGEKKGKVVENLPVWKTSGPGMGGRRIVFFDGFSFYDDNEVSHFRICNQEFDQSIKDGQNGNGINSTMLGEWYLFLEVDGSEDKLYYISTHKPDRIEKRWFENILSEEMILQYKNSMNNTMNSSIVAPVLVDEPEQNYVAYSSEPTPKDYSDLKIGKLAQTVFKDMLEAGKATDEEVMLMQQADYSKKTFDLQFPVLVRADDFFFDSKRYYSKPLTIRGVQYMMCSQWFETSANNDRPYLLAWIKKHS